MKKITKQKCIESALPGDKVLCLFNGKIYTIKEVIAYPNGAKAAIFTNQSDFDGICYLKQKRFRLIKQTNK